MYSLLFLVVQFGTTTFTPRLNLFRDAPIVWHAFSFFTAVIVFAFTAAFEIGKAAETSALVPVVLGVFVLVALGLLRSLQAAAFNSIQLASTLEQVARRGCDVIDGVYPESVDATAGDDGSDGSARASRLPANRREVRWPGRAATVQVIDVPRLLADAEETDVLIDVCVSPGETVQERDLVAVIRGGSGLNDRGVIRAFAVGNERTFEQDPALALRVFADIALRALSPAINEPTTAVQALDRIDSLLRVLATRELDVGWVDGANGSPRLRLKLPSWDDYVAVALDEIIVFCAASPQVLPRVRRLLKDSLALAPPQRRVALKARLDRLPDSPATAQT